MQRFHQSTVKATSQLVSETEATATARRYERNGEKAVLVVKILTEEELEELEGIVSEDAKIIGRERDGSEFHKYARVFNGSIQSPACVVVRPALTKDVSE
jgi:hypothetical protein